MSLGTDNTVCKKEFVEAMRAVLDAMKPPQGSNVDPPNAANDNLGALGTAVFNIATKDAETWSDNTADAAFWQWVAAVQIWIGDVRQAFSAWNPTAAADQTLKTSVLAASLPGSPPGTAPTSMTGTIK